MSAVWKPPSLGFVLSVAAAFLLLLVPLPQALLPWKPYWLALVLIYWCLEGEGGVTLGAAFALGLTADILVGDLLGEQALRLVALIFIVTRFRSRLRFFPMWQQTAAVLALLVNDRVLLLMLRAMSGHPWPSAAWWLPPLTGALLWPFIFLLLDGLRTRVRASE